MRCRLDGWLVLLVAAVLTAWISPLEPFERPGIHVLYIGNSLTDANDLPGTVAGLTVLGGGKMSYTSVTKPDFALLDHVDGGSDAVSQIKRGGWDFVVMQQGPSSLPEGREWLIRGVKKFDALIKASGARPAIYMVWPDKSRYAYFEDVRISYKLAADVVGGLFLPAGEAWLTAWQEDPQLPLYSSDSFHPSAYGTYLAALVIYERLTGKDARELPPKMVVAGQRFNVPEKTVRLLQRAAHTTNTRYTDGDRTSYRYIPETLKLYPAQRAVRDRMEHAGFVDAGLRKFENVFIKLSRHP